MKTLKFTLAILIFPLILSAQDYWQGGISVGATSFSGDINPRSTPSVNDIRLGFGVSGRIQATSQIGFKGSLIYGQFVGDDANYPERADRALSFKTNVIELAGIGEWEPFAKDRYYSDAKGDLQMDKLISPYVFLGVGLAFAQLNTDFSKDPGNNDIRTQGIAIDRIQGTSKTALVVPFGFGVKYDLNNYWTLGLDIGWRLSFSDYLDGISFAGNPDNDDVYFITSFTAYYRFFQ